MSTAPDHKHRLCAEVFASVPSPGHPLGIATADDGTVYVGTHQAAGEPNVPSKVFAFDQHGKVVQEWQIDGQAENGQGITGIALDADGVLYIADQTPARVVTLDPRTGEQKVYAELPDVELCSAGGQPGACSEAATDRPSQPINLAFGPDGNLYVGDLTQAAIWRISPGGGSAEVWYTAADLDSLFGPNTVKFLDRGRTLLFADSATGLQDPANLPTAKGRLIKLTVNEDGSPSERETFWEAQGDGETPDGFAVGESGTVYVALAVANTLAVISPDGAEITRVPLTPEQNAERKVPFDLPGGVSFFGRKVLVTNQVFLGGDGKPVVFSIDVHEGGKALFRPHIPRP